MELSSQRLLVVIIISLCTPGASEASSFSLQLSSSSSTTSLTNTSWTPITSFFWMMTRRHHRHNPAFTIIPRGGSSTDTDENLSKSEELIDVVVFDDDDDDPSSVADEINTLDKSDHDNDAVTDNSLDSDYYRSSHAASCQIAEKDDYHPAIIDPNIFSPTHLTSLLLSAARRRHSITSAMMHYASLAVRVTQRACLAGARAIMLPDDDWDDSEIDSSSDNCTSAQRRKSGGKKPMVHTLIERTVYVLGEMYHAAITSSEGEGEDKGDSRPVLGQKEADVERKRNRRRRRHRHDHHSTKRHHNNKKHHNSSRHTKAIKVISNGGGIEPSSSSSSSSSSSQHEAIIQLAKLYNKELSKNDGTNGSLLSKKYDSILLSSQTTIHEALEIANSNARFLICYISKRRNKSNAIAVPNLLSPEIIKLANRKALGKKQVGGDYASFYIWIVNDDAHVESAMKRLGIKPSKRPGAKKMKKPSNNLDDPPILAVIYPATTVDPSSGRPRISSRILAQHHCNPPPTTSEALTSWVNSIRKRHLREYAKMQHACTERLLLMERNKGYVDSIQDDEIREAKEERELQLKKEGEERERNRLRELELRRQDLLNSLADEPPVVGIAPEDVITIALRFNDGKRDQRRFLADETSINDVCNWVDAIHGMEREKIELHTMNGARKFVYMKDRDKDLTLREAGLARMTALRIVEVEDEANTTHKSKNKNDDDDDQEVNDDDQKEDGDDEEERSDDED